MRPARRPFLVCLTAGAALWWCAGPADAQQHPPAGALDPRGAFWLRPEATYQHFCAACHGESGDGDGRYYPSDLVPAPARFADPAFHQAREDARLRTAVEQGSTAVGGTPACPAWGATLPPASLLPLLDWMRGLAPSATPAADPVPEPPAVAPPAARAGPGALLPAGGSLLLALIALLQWRRRPLDLCRPHPPDRRSS